MSWGRTGQVSCLKLGVVIPAHSFRLSSLSRTHQFGQSLRQLITFWLRLKYASLRIVSRSSRVGLSCKGSSRRTRPKRGQTPWYECRRWRVYELNGCSLSVGEAHDTEQVRWSAAFCLVPPFPRLRQPVRHRRARRARAARGGTHFVTRPAAPSNKATKYHTSARRLRACETGLMGVKC